MARRRRWERCGYSGKFDASAGIRTWIVPIASYKQGKTPAATDELASYLRLEPTDVAARQTTLSCFTNR